jgi:hypothetical protein
MSFNPVFYFVLQRASYDSSETKTGCNITAASPSTLKIKTYG